MHLNVFRSARFGLALLLALAAGHAWAGSTEDERARNAVRVLKDIREIPEQSIPDKLLDEGRAIVVIPDTLKAGFVIGGRRGHGLLSVKTPDGSWSQPVFIKLTGGSIGFQAGVQSSDVVLVFRNDRALDNIVNGKFTLGADAAVAAGPVGRNAAAATDGQLRAEIWSWSRARGLFAGVALDGAVLSIDNAANVSVYGRNATPRAIFENRVGTPSETVIAFRDELEESTHAAQIARGTDGTQHNVTHTTPMANPQGKSPGVETQGINSQQNPPQPVQQAQQFQQVEANEIRTEPLSDSP